MECPLTTKQADILSRVAQAKSNEQIANELGVEPGTVAGHIRQVSKKLGTLNRGQICVIALREGWIDPLPIIPLPPTKAPCDPPLTIAERCYLKAFDRMLKDRTDENAAHLSACFTVMCGDRRVPDRRGNAPQHFDLMLTRLAKSMKRLIPK